MLGHERLLQLREALLFGDPLDAEARLELLRLVEHAAGARRPGRPANTAMRTAAAVVGVLVENHGIPVKAALTAAAPRASATERRSIERTYRELRSSGQAIQVSRLVVEPALKRARRK
jgi:hypothetical protein